MIKLNNKGFGAVEVILVLVIVGLIGGVGYYYVYNSQKKTNIALDNAANSQPEPQKSEKTKEDSKKTVTIKEWEVSFVMPNSIQDITYEFDTNSKGDEYQTIILDSMKLEDSGLIKSAGPESREKLGSLHRVKPNTDSGFANATTYEDYATQNGYASKQIGNYFFFYEPLHTTSGFFNSEYKTDLNNAIQDTLSNS